MEFFKQGNMSWSLESYRIGRREANSPLMIRATLRAITPGMEPPELLLRVEFESANLPTGDESQLGHQILRFLRRLIP